MGIEVKNSVQETIKNLESQEQTPETVESVRALKEAFNTEVTQSIAEFKNGDGEVEKIEQSVKLNNPEVIREIEGELKVQETLQNFDIEAEKLQENTLDDKKDKVNPVEIDWGNVDIYNNSPAVWDTGFLDKENLSEEENLFRYCNVKITNLFSNLRMTGFVETNKDITPDEQNNLRKEFLNKNIKEIDFNLIGSALGSEYKYTFFEKINELYEQLDNNDYNDQMKRERLSVKEYLSSGIAKIIKNDPEMLSMQEFFNDSKNNDIFDEKSYSVTFKNREYRSDHVLEGVFGLYNAVENKLENNPESKEIMDKNLEFADVDYAIEYQYENKNKINYIGSFAKEVVKQNFNKIANEKLLSGNENSARKILESKFDFIKNNAEMIAKNKIEDDFKIPDFNIDAWRGKYGIKFNENLETMKKIENIGPGSVKKLYDDYGIMEFHRYPAEVLISQVEEENTQQPYGVIVFPRSDHNDAFDEKKYIFNKLYSETRGKYGIKIAECESKTDLARKFITLDKKYGEKNKIAFLLMGGHGSGDGLNLGEYRTREEAEGEELSLKAIFKVESGSPGFKKANEKYLDKDAEIVLLSCSAGIVDGIADKFSSSYDKKIMAPVIPVSKLDLDINYDVNGKPHFKAIYDQNEAISATFGERKL